MTFIIIAFWLVFFPQLGMTFPSWMENDYCLRDIRPGAIIMNYEAALSDTLVLSISREHTKLNSGDIYNFGELLTVNLPKSDGEFIFQVKNAIFVSGGCEGTRSCDHDAVLQMPDKPETVSVWAGKLLKIY